MRESNLSEHGQSERDVAPSRARSLLLIFVALIAWIGVACLMSATHASAATYSKNVPVAPRLQWNSNYGYCGETSFIVAGMRFGQYTSQWTARRLATDWHRQWLVRSQLLVGINDQRAARKMKLSAVEFDSASQSSPKQFLGWIKSELVTGGVPVIGLFNNTRKMGEGGRGDSEYDHIVPVMGVSSAQPLMAGGDPRGYLPSDRITFSDNGVYTGGPPGDRQPFLFNREFSEFPMSRSQANLWSSPVYSLKRQPPNYGVSIRGPLDPEGETIPVRLSSDSRGEGKRNKRWLTHKPKGFKIHLRAHVRPPDPSASYRVFMYDSFGRVPTRDFAAHADRARRSWLISPGDAGADGEWSVRVRARSGDTRVFRAVRVDS